MIDHLYNVSNMSKDYIPTTEDYYHIIVNISKPETLKFLMKSYPGNGLNLINYNNIAQKTLPCAYNDFIFHNEIGT